MSIFKEYDIGIGRKVVRETLRIKRDIVGAFDKLKFRQIQKRYDKQWPAQLTLTSGAKSTSKKIAIFVLYQPEGLRCSIYDTCKHLSDNGYGVLIVSNCPLTPQDKRKLSTHVFHICERPNYGYDAGAYRDGAKLLPHLGLRPSHVVLLNDSIWFPLLRSNDRLSQLENQNSGFGGLVRKTKAKEDKKAGQETAGFIEAYFYHANLSTKNSLEDFVTHWNDLPLTVGRQGLRESRISQSYLKANDPLTALVSRTRFLTAVATLSNEELRKVLEYGAYPVAELRTAGQKLLQKASDNVWREDVLRHVETTVNRYPFYGAFIYASENQFSLGFLKRTRTPLFDETRRAYLRAVSAGDLPTPSETVLAEIESLVTKH